MLEAERAEITEIHKVRRHEDNEAVTSCFVMQVLSVTGF
jgi:hypothetical protein